MLEETQPSLAEERGVRITTALSETKRRIDGLGALTVLSSLLSMGTKLAPRGTSVELTAAREGGGVLFEVKVPGMDVPRARIDRLEPPGEIERGIAERLQLFALCSAIAMRTGGSLEIRPFAPSVASIRLLWPQA
jgi:hypothetical protein